MRATRLTSLLIAAFATGTLIAGAAAPAQAAERSDAVIAMSRTQVLSAKALLAGAENPGDYKKYGGCKLVGKQLACWAKPWVDKRVGYTPLRVSPRLQVPVSITKQAKPGTLRMQVKAKLSHVSGKVSWAYGGSYSALKNGSFTHSGTRTLGKADLTGAFAYGGKTLPVLDFGFAKGARATFERVTVTYTYEVAAN